MIQRGLRAMIEGSNYPPQSFVCLAILLYVFETDVREAPSNVLIPLDDPLKYSGVLRSGSTPLCSPLTPTLLIVDRAKSTHKEPGTP